MQLSRLKNSSCLQAYCEQNISIQIFTLTPLNSPGCKLYNGILVCYNIFKIQVQVGQLELQCTKSAPFLDICGPGARSPYPERLPKSGHIHPVWLLFLFRRTQQIQDFCAVSALLQCICAGRLCCTSSTFDSPHLLCGWQ